MVRSCGVTHVTAQNAAPVQFKGHETAHSAGKLKSDDVFASLAAITDAGLLTVLILALLLIVVGPVHAEPKPPPFTEDVMIVFDASGFMVGNLDQGIAPSTKDR